MGPPGVIWGAESTASCPLEQTVPLRTPRAGGGSEIKSKLARLKTMGPLELDGATCEESMGPIEQVGPLKEESTGPFGDNGGAEASWGPRTSGATKTRVTRHFDDHGGP